MASNITVDTLTKGSTTLNTDEIVDTNSNQICKAWVNFNGTGTVAIRDSYNVSSITDESTGSWVVNLTNSMGNTSFLASANQGININNNRSANTSDILSSSTIRVRHYEADAQYDITTMNCLVFGD